MAFWPYRGKMVWEQAACFVFTKVRRNTGLSLKKWMKLFGATILIGGVVSLILGVIMVMLDTFEIPKADDWLFNLTQMFLSGLTLGAFAHMGFFAYLTLNYIARSIFKRPYLWVACQGFVTVFMLVEVAVNLYDSDFPGYAFWAVPLVLAAASAAVSWIKVKETTSASWIPALFFMIVITVLEAIPAFREGSIASLIYMVLPLFLCNAYQLMMLHRLLGDPLAKPSAPQASQPGKA
jgi:KinB signaling pathway activation protein